MKITVYSKPACAQCRATYRQLKLRSLPYEVVDLSRDAAALEMVRGMGHLAAPVVIVTDDVGEIVQHWSGFRPAEIKALAQVSGLAA